LTGNVQPFVILAVVIAMIASQRGRPALAGLILALATAVKILPGVLAIYWLFSRRRDCFAWFVAGMIVFASASLVLAGVGPNIAFLKNVHALSGVLVPSWFNEGLPTFLYGFVGEIDLGASLRLVPVPAWISAMTCAATLGGLAVILLGARRARDLPAADAAGMAASFLLVTIASPMAWTEYYVFLAVPAVIWGGLTAGRAGWILPVAVAVLASFVAKLALEALVRIGAPRFLVESELIAAVALLIGLWAARRQLFRRVGVSARGNRHGQPDGDAFDD
jgi:hypothetical protein